MPRALGWIISDDSSMSQWERRPPTANTPLSNNHIAHYWGPQEDLCNIAAHWSICWSQSSPKGSFQLKQQEENGAAQTVNFNQSPVLCVSPACWLFAVPLSFGWACCSGSSYLCCVGVGAWSHQGVIGAQFLDCNHNFMPLDSIVLLILGSSRSFIQMLTWVSDSPDEAEHLEKFTLTKDTKTN